MGLQRLSPARRLRSGSARFINVLGPALTGAALVNRALSVRLKLAAFPAP
jgi:hypothetical protein